MYLAIESQGGVYGGGMVYCVYFIVLVLFGNCKFYKLFSFIHLQFLLRWVESATLNSLIKRIFFFAQISRIYWLEIFSLVERKRWFNYTLELLTIIFNCIWINGKATIIKAKTILFSTELAYRLIKSANVLIFSSYMEQRCLIGWRSFSSNLLS